MKLTTPEVFKILSERYYDFLTSTEDHNKYNAVVHALRECVESFSNGELEVVIKKKD